jgi:hypothetical protein
MAKRTTAAPVQTPPITEHVPSVKGDLSAIASANAPLIFFDSISNAGFYNGIAHITLEAMRFITINGTATNDRVVTAYLRMNYAALTSLKAAIAHVEDVAKKAAAETKH